MLIDIPEEDWVVFARANHAELGDLLLNLAAKVDLSEFEKNKRSPIKAPNSKNQFKGKPHGSIWIPVSSVRYATSKVKRGLSRPLPRMRTLCTN
jgi:hypothetical protein